MADPVELIRSAKEKILPLAKEAEREKLSASFDSLQTILTGLKETAQTVQTETYWEDDSLITATRTKFALLVTQWKKLLPTFQAYVDEGWALKNPNADDPTLALAKAMDVFLIKAQEIVNGTESTHRFRVEHPLSFNHPLFEPVHNVIFNYAGYLTPVVPELPFCDTQQLRKKLDAVASSIQPLTDLLLRHNTFRRASFEPIYSYSPDKHQELFKFPEARTALIDWWEQHKEEINKIPLPSDDDASILEMGGYIKFLRKLVTELQRSDVEQLANIIAAHKAAGETKITAALVAELSDTKSEKKRLAVG